MSRKGIASNSPKIPAIGYGTGILRRWKGAQEQLYEKARGNAA
jgi:hypothetical protein